MRLLKRDFTGQPVIAVATSWPDIDVDSISNRSSEKLLSRVQDVAEAFSTPERQCVPFAIRGAWVLAPGTREEVNTDFSRFSPTDVSGRGRLLTELIVALSAREVDFLCSPNGIVAGSLDTKRQAMLARALRPSFRAVAIRPTANYPGSFDEVADSSRRITVAPDLKRVRIRAQIRSSAPQLLITRRQPNSDYEYTDAYDLGQTPAIPRIVLQPDGDDMGFYRAGTDLPALNTVPNTFKPSDLEGKALVQPFGAHGVMTVNDTLKRLTVVTGRKFKASEQYGALQVYVGADTVTCGEVADGLRLALTATWRKIGDIYFLTWEKMGLGALQTYVLERAQDLTHASDKAGADAENSEAWLDLAMRIPFAADDPFGWTAGQRQSLFGPRAKKPNGSSETPYVRWPALTPSQQSSVRQLVVGRKIFVPDPANNEGRSVERELTDRDIPLTGLRGSAKMELLVDFGDGNWVTLGDWWNKMLDQGNLDSLRYQRQNRLDEAKRKAEEARTNASGLPPRNIRYRQPDRSLAPARMRALMVPVLAPGSLAKLATQMQVRGITTLFYPILSDGYSTFPSKAFPPHPAMASPNGWLACVNTMKAAGITVVGTMETLAWRKPGEKGHWLDKHPGWMALDILGRSLTEHVRAESGRLLTPMPEAVGDLVRGTEPQVVTRLTTLLSEFMRQPGSTGICLDAWSYETALSSRRGPSFQYYPTYGSNANPLGYAVPDRLASILKDSVDPVDVPLTWGGGFTPPAQARATVRRVYPEGVSRIADGPPQPPPSPYMALASSLLPKARPDAAPWKTYAVISNDGRSGYAGGAVNAPPASVLLNTGRTGYNPGASQCVLFRVPRRADMAGTPENPSQNAYQPAILSAEGQAYGYNNGQALDFAVYDFRGAPEEITDSLRRVGLPEAVEETPAANRPAAR